MMKIFLIPFIAALSLFPMTASAATFEFPIRIDAVTGDGEGINLGFFSTASVGDLGTGSARTDFDFPSNTPAPLSGNSLFQAVFPGIASAASFFANPVVHDPTAGTVTVSGALGGVTGPYSEFLSAGAFEFVYQGAPGGAAFASIGDYETFLSTATMSGYFEGVFFVGSGIDDEVGFEQRIDFSDATQIPLPAGALLLLSGIGLLMARRKT